MADTLRDNHQRRRIHLTVAALTLLVALMFVSAAWLRLA
jgi:hypothetical protein